MDPLIRIRIRIRIRIWLVVRLINELAHEREEDHRVSKCLNGDVLQLPVNPSN